MYQYIKHIEHTYNDQNHLWHFFGVTPCLSTARYQGAICFGFTLLDICVVWSSCWANSLIRTLAIVLTFAPLWCLWLGQKILKKIIPEAQTVKHNARNIMPRKCKNWKRMFLTWRMLQLFLPIQWKSLRPITTRNVIVLYRQKKQSHFSKCLIFCFDRRRMPCRFWMTYNFWMTFQDKQWNNYHQSIWQLDLCLNYVSFPYQSKKMKGCKRRDSFRWLLWRHVSLSLRDKSTQFFLSRQKTRTFRQHVSFPHLPYLTQQCFCLSPFVPRLTLFYPTLLENTDTLHYTLIFHNRTCMWLLYKKNPLNFPYRYNFVSQLLEQ